MSNTCLISLSISPEINYQLKLIITILYAKQAAILLELQSRKLARYLHAEALESFQRQRPPQLVYKDHSRLSFNHLEWNGSAMSNTCLISLSISPEINYAKQAAILIELISRKVARYLHTEAIESFQRQRPPQLVYKDHSRLSFNHLEWNGSAVSNIIPVWYHCQSHQRLIISWDYYDSVCQASSDPYRIDL